MDPNTKEKEKENLQIQFRDADGVCYSVPKSVCVCFGTIKNLLEDCSEVSGPIALKSISKQTMGLIVEFATHYEEILFNPYNLNYFRDLTEWDWKFFGPMTTEALFDLMCATNFLDYEDLLVMTQKFVAFTIYDLTPEEIRRKFGIEDVVYSDEKRPLKRKRQ